MDIAPASPYYCDPIDDNTRFAFEAVPERLFIILDGKIVYRGGEGPFGYKPEEVANWLADNFPSVDAPPPPPSAVKKKGGSGMGMAACAGAVVCIAAATYLVASRR